MSTTELARVLGWSQSKVSRVERGVTLAKPDEVADWSRALHAPADLRRRLAELSERQAIELITWKQQVAPGRRKRQEEIKELEAAASTIWVCPLAVVPGLAQTARYAETIFRIGRDRAISDDEVNGAVTARMARQEALRDRTKRFKMLFTETAVRRSLLPGVDMRQQLERLIEVARLHNVEMAMIPFATRERALSYHGFSILGDPDVDSRALVIVGTVTRTLTIRDPDEVREYIAHYDRLAEGAVFGDELVTLLREISAEAPWS